MNKLIAIFIIILAVTAVFSFLLGMDMATDMAIDAINEIQVVSYSKEYLKTEYIPVDIDIRGGENNTVMASGVIMIDCKNVTVDRGGEDQLVKCEKLPTNHDKKTGELK